MQSGDPTSGATPQRAGALVSTRAGDLGLSLRGATPLLIGLSVLLMSVGLQNAVVGLRARAEGFGSLEIGAVMSLYYVGFLAGSRRAPADLQRVGHVRVFAALASIASASVLLHPVLIHPIAWAALRALNGYCISGLYVTAESWLNAESNNSIRGTVLSAYLVVIGVGLSAGQLAINFADVAGPNLFVLASVLSSVSLLPLVLTPTPGPRFVEPDRLPLRRVAAMVPLGVFGCFVSGVTQGAIFGLGAVYGDRIGLRISEISVLLTLLTVGGVVLQFPIGVLSDRIDRRSVIAATGAAAAAFALLLIPVVGPGWDLWVLAFFLGGLSLPLYSLAAAHANDYLTDQQVVPVAGTLVLVFGAGATIGPIGGSSAMRFGGDEGFLWYLAAWHLLLGAYAAWRITQRGAAPQEDRATYLETLPPEGAQVDLVEVADEPEGIDPLLT